ncbi:hydroquinone glucosyltransferase-like [Lotus japonicus]|uniref:hydroquinone glucosyltransferase-like n=1 Tax=Lotus japonicus TaxID=34305 RepID=UPI00258F7E3F|nr:hydroquinone glucosyltransferase-like [Lotus japonicus]
MEATTHIAIVTVPVYSHQRSILEFCKRLVHLHQDIHITCINPTSGPPCKNVKALFESLPSNIEHMFLPPPNLEDMLHNKPHPGLLIQVAILRSLPSIYNALETLHHSRSKLVAIVADGLITEALPMAKKLNVLSYAYFPSTAMLLSLCLYAPMLDKKITCEYRDLTELIEIPGCIPIHGTDLPDQFKDRSSVEYKVFLEANERFYSADGFLINTFLDLEPVTIRAWQEKKMTSPTSVPYVYPVGPFVQGGSYDNQGKDIGYMRWLDKQEPNSVLYVSFGSGGTLTNEQTNELAWGLELSGKKFLWVLRPPHKFNIIDEFGAENDEDPLKFLPNGFLERTQGQGLVVPYWAAQIEILCHKAIGGFLCHCGWNSTLESIVHGIPIVAWPLFAEQKMNAAMLTNGLKVALRPKLNEKGIVEREEVADIVKNLMEGEEGKGIRKRMEKLKDDAADAMKEDGSSTRTLTQLALIWKKLRVE